MAVAPFAFTSWPQGMIQLLDEHHLVVLADDTEVRRHYSLTMIRQLRSLPDTEVIVIQGNHVRDLNGFCNEIGQGLRIRQLSGTENGFQFDDLVSALRCNEQHTGRRYFVWHNADVLLDADVELFNRLVNALFSVAAEHEHLISESLLIQRTIFVGDEKLGAYAEDTNRQFWQWLNSDEDSPFWEVTTIVDRPPVITYRIDA